MSIEKAFTRQKKYLVSRYLLLHLFCPFFCIPAIFLGRSYAVFVLNLPQPLEQCLMLDVVGSLLSQQPLFTEHLIWAENGTLPSVYTMR